MEHGLVKNSKISESATRIRVIVDEAVKEGEISHNDYDKIIEITGEDGHVDVHEQAILTELHQMLHDKELKFKKVVKPEMSDGLKILHQHYTNHMTLLLNMRKSVAVVPREDMQEQLAKAKSFRDDIRKLETSHNIKYRKSDHTKETFVALGELEIGGYYEQTPPKHYEHEDVFYMVFLDIPVKFGRMHYTEEEAKKEIERAINMFLNQIKTR